MNIIITVLIAAVTVNCLVTAINGKEATDTPAVPYIDTLLPPLEDVQDKSSKDAQAKVIATTKATSVYKATKTTTTATTKKPITNHENNILPELSSEALLPPLFEAKIEKEETIKSPETTSTTAKPKTTTTRRTTTTAKPAYTTRTTTLKPNLKVPDLFLDPLQPPLLENDKTDVKDEKITTTTQKPITTTLKQKLNQPKQQTKYFQVNKAGNQVKNYNKPAVQNKHVAESQAQIKQISLNTHQQSINLKAKHETFKQQYVAKPKTTNSKYVGKQFNYSFDLYFSSTTPRPIKSGLPTITPFPHRLGR